MKNPMVCSLNTAMGFDFRTTSVKPPESPRKPGLATRRAPLRRTVNRKTSAQDAYDARALSSRLSAPLSTRAFRRDARGPAFAGAGPSRVRSLISLARVWRRAPARARGAGATTRARVLDVNDSRSMPRPPRSPLSPVTGSQEPQEARSRVRGPWSYWQAPQAPFRSR